MKVIPQLELIITEEISKNISLFKRKNNASVLFISYKEGKSDKYNNVYYVTCIKETDVKELKDCKISINEIFKKAIVIFYVTANVNNSDSDTCYKVAYADLIISPDMLSLAKFSDRDILKEEFLANRSDEDLEMTLIEQTIMEEDDDDEYLVEKTEILKIYHEDDVLLYEDTSDRDYDEDVEEDSDDVEDDIDSESDDTEDDLISEDNDTHSNSKKSDTDDELDVDLDIDIDIDEQDLSSGADIEDDGLFLSDMNTEEFEGFEDVDPLGS